MKLDIADALIKYRSNNPPLGSEMQARQAIKTLLLPYHANSSHSTIKSAPKQRKGPQSTSIMQLNMQHSSSATSNLLIETNELKHNFICCLQEPYTTNGTITGLDSSKHTYSSGSVPRAAIYSDIKLWMVPKYSARDITTCIWTPESNEEEIYIASIYLDSTLNIQDNIELQKLFKFCTKKHKPLLCCLDSNAHSSLWGCPTNNKRGEILEELILAYGLQVLNIGNIDTFVTTRASSIIDITLATTDILPLVTQWHVREDDAMSDHRLITMKVQTGEHTTKKGRNLARADWSLFKETLKTSTTKWVEPLRWNHSTIETELRHIMNEIDTALDIVAPITPFKPPSKPKWWNPDLQVLRTNIKRQYRRAVRAKTTDEWISYRTLRNDYTKSLRKAKRQTWQKFCSDTENPKGMAKLTTMLQRNTKHHLGLLKGQDGKVKPNPEQSLQLLLDVHFPNSVRKDPTGEDDQTSDFVNNISPYQTLEDSDIFTNTKIRKAITQFGPHKAPGPDGLKPIILQHLPDQIITRLSLVYQASLQMAYIPKGWRKSNTIFIPKPGKPDYGIPKAFRPISLSCFMFKTMERLIYWHLEQTALQEHPLHSHQHAFRRGCSTESALSTAVDDIENAILRGTLALGVFLDIEGAFDNLQPKAAVKGMQDHGFPQNIIDWYSKYLSNRTCSTTIGTTTEERYLTQGTPQGGVLSPLLWNLAFDQFLSLYDTGPVKVTGFADDALLLIKGIDHNTLVSQMQIALDKALKWGREDGLKFSHPKTVVVMFHRKYNYQYTKQLQMGGIKLPFSEEAKYLGITLDHKLSWNIHISHKIKQAKANLMRLRAGIGTFWGPSPHLIRWAYTGIVLPALTYGSLVWGKVAQSAHSKVKLNSLQRLATMLMGPVRTKTPSAGLEIITYLVPLDLLIQGEAIAASYRLKNKPAQWLGFGPQGKGHLKWISDLESELHITPKTPDAITPVLRWTKKYTVDLSSLSTGDNPDVIGISCYTDGSKIKTAEGEPTGAGYVIINRNKPGKPILDFNHKYLGTSPTVFQAELTAITEACPTIAKVFEPSTANKHKFGILPHKEVTFFSDSQAALLSLDHHIIKSLTVLDCHNNLNLLAKTCKVTLRWIKAHVDHRGNEMADQEAKQGALLGGSVLLPLPLSKTIVRSQIRTRIDQAWNTRWQDGLDCRQTKLFFPSPDKNKSYAITKMSRLTFGQITRFITGHNFLRRHEQIVHPDPFTSKLCRLCENEEETAWHIVAECDCLHKIRGEIFGQYFLVEEGPWKVSQLKTFLNHPDVNWIEDLPD